MKTLPTATAGEASDISLAVSAEQFVRRSCLNHECISAPARHRRR